MTCIRFFGLFWFVSAAGLVYGCTPQAPDLPTPPEADERPLIITGELAYRPRIAVPAETVALVQLLDTIDGSVVVAQQRIALQGRQVPVAFELSIEVADLGPDGAYSLNAALLIDGQRLWINEGIEIGARSGVLDLRTVWLERAAVEPEGVIASLRCGDQEVFVSVDGDRTFVLVGAERIPMRQVEAASGARYVAEDDPSTILWNKGESATLSLRGVTYPECHALTDENAIGNDVVRARGNEPAWLLPTAGQ